MAYKVFGKSKINSIGMDNMSTESQRNKNKNHKEWKVLHKCILHPVGSKPCWGNSRLWLKACLAAPVIYSLLLQFTRYSMIQNNRSKKVWTLGDKWFHIKWRENSWICRRLANLGVRGETFCYKTSELISVGKCLLN